MKKINLIILSIMLTFLQSCKSKEDKAKDVVKEFLMEINDPTKTVNNNLMTLKFAEFFRTQELIYTADKWELTAKPENDTIITVEAKGQTHNSLGQPTELLQSFSLTNEFGGWKIFDSYNLVSDELDFEIVDIQWKFYGDREKDYILKQLQDKLELKVMVPGYGNSWFPDSRKGKLRLINNSDFDIKGVKILIEHFDKDGKSVNTSHTSVWDIIRKHGYREFDWYTSDCSTCVRQEFKINFIRESN